MNVQQTNIQLPQEIFEQLKLTIPSKKRNQFIVNAISEKLENAGDIKKQLKKSLKENEHFYKTIAKEWKETEINQWPTK
ncbi:MAG: hypothetical protein AAB553_03750 [Patescibacteria group bacterium]